MIMPKHLHWSQRFGRQGKFMGTLYMKLLTDDQQVKALVMNVANGQRACVQVHDGSFHDKYWVKDLATGVENCNQFYLN